MSPRKIRLVSEESLPAQVGPIVADAMVDNPNVVSSIQSKVDDLASNSAALAGAYATHGVSRRNSIAETGAVVLTLDDGKTDQYEVAAPTVAEVGGRLTIGVTTNLIGTPNFGTRDHIIEAAENGHEICWHGHDHKPMGTVSDSERVTEWSGKEILDDILYEVPGQRVTTALFPHNSFSERAVQEAYGRFERVFAGPSHPYVHDARDPSPEYLRGRLPWSYDSNGVSSHARVMDSVREAADRGSIITLYSHNVTTGGSTHIDRDSFEELVALTDDLGIPIVSAREAFPMAVNIPNAGFEDPNVGAQSYYAIYNTNATNTVESVLDAPQIGFYGERSLRIAGDGTTRPRLLIGYPPIQRVGQEQITVSCRLRMNYLSGPGAHIEVEQRDIWNQNIKTTKGPSVATTAGWGQYRFDFTPEPGCTHMRLLLVLDHTRGEVFFDHAHIGPTRYGALG